jgi:putative flippase GtrA
MLQRLVDIIKKHKAVVLYCAFGLLTTVVNYVFYFPLLYIAGFTAVLSNVIAWFAAVMFSFITSKAFVFKSNDWSHQTLLHELLGFFGCRFITGLLETILLFVFVDALQMNGLFWKLVLSLGIVVCNYLSSQRLVFRNNDKHPID